MWSKNFIGVSFSHTTSVRKSYILYWVVLRLTFSYINFFTYFLSLPTDQAIKPLRAGHFGSSQYTRKECEGCKWIYKRSYICIVDHHSYKHNLSSCEITAWKKFRPEQDSNPWPLQYWCSALLTELSSHWELVTLWVRNIPI